MLRGWLELINNEGRQRAYLPLAVLSSLSRQQIELLDYAYSSDDARARMRAIEMLYFEQALRS